MSMRTMTVLLASAMLAVVGCGRMDSRELAEQVKAEMQRDLVKRDLLDTLKVERVTLVHQEGNAYAGKAVGEVYGQPVQFDVTCQYDGTSVLWDAELVGDNPLTLLGRKGELAVRNALATNWPAFKADLRKRYDEAVRKSGDLFARAKADIEAKCQALTGIFEKDPVAVSNNQVRAENELFTSFETAVAANDYRTCLTVARGFARRKSYDLALAGYRTAIGVALSVVPDEKTARKFLSDLSGAVADTYGKVGTDSACVRMAEAMRKAHETFANGKATEAELKAAYGTLTDFQTETGVFAVPAASGAVARPAP